VLAAAGAVVAWIAIEMSRTGKATATGASIATVVGLVAITPAAGYVGPMSAIAIGAIAAVVCSAALKVFQKVRVDDTLDVFACHGVGGIVGSLLTGVFASKAINPDGADGLIFGNSNLLFVQFESVVATAVYSAAVTGAVLLAVRAIYGLRASEEAESLGIDLAEHAELAYARDYGESLPAFSAAK
jgi:Amt family ammonium transporter